MTEPLLEPDDKRFVVLPVKYQDLYDMYKKYSKWNNHYLLSSKQCKLNNYKVFN